MKKVVVLYSSDDWEKTVPLEGSPETRSSFEDFYTFARAQGVDCFRANVDWYDAPKNVFKKAWTFDGKWKKINTPVTPDAFFDKLAGRQDYELFGLKSKMAARGPVVNPPLFRTLFDNKLSQYLVFSEFMPKTFLAENAVQFGQALEQISTPRVVIKELYGSGGNQVSIVDKDAASAEGQPYPVLLQEFIKTAGIPDFSPEGAVADLRLVYVGDALIYALSRLAKPGSLFTNFHQGATATLVPLERIPQNCLALAEQIQKRFSVFSRINYSLDFMFDTEGRPLFIEMNTTPGFDLLRLVGTPEIKETYYRTLLATFE